MKNALIGHTGFVGSNLVRQHAFSHCYNSKNIAEIAGESFDMLVCSGVQAKKWWANQNPAEDWAGIEALLTQLDKVKAKKCVVISSVDVYPRITDVDENFDCHAAENHAYGSHRLRFEDEVKKRFDNVYILRLSGLFGVGLKKNVIYDLMNDNCLEMINPKCAFQWYGLDGLWADINWAVEKNIRLVNLVNEPLPTSEILKLFPGKKVGEKAGPEVHYGIRTIHAPSGYLKSAAAVKNEIAAFVKEEMKRCA